MISLQDARFVNVLAPVADAFAGTVWPAGVNMSGLRRLWFIVQKGVGTTGTSTLTVIAGDDNSPTNQTAVTFRYRRIAADNTTVGDVTAATTAGFTTTAGSSDLYVIEVDAQALASSGYKYAHLKAVESVNDPVLLGVIAIGFGGHGDDTSDIVS